MVTKLTLENSYNIVLKALAVLENVESNWKNYVNSDVELMNLATFEDAVKSNLERILSNSEELQVLNNTLDLILKGNQITTECSLKLTLFVLAFTLHFNCPFTYCGDLYLEISQEDSDLLAKATDKKLEVYSQKFIKGKYIPHLDDSSNVNLTSGNKKVIIRLQTINTSFFANNYLNNGLDGEVIILPFTKFDLIQPGQDLILKETDNLILSHSINLEFVGSLYEQMIYKNKSFNKYDEDFNKMNMLFLIRGIMHLSEKKIEDLQNQLKNTYALTKLFFYLSLNFQESENPEYSAYLVKTMNSFFEIESNPHFSYLDIKDFYFYFAYCGNVFLMYYDEEFKCDELREKIQQKIELIHKEKDLELKVYLEAVELTNKCFRLANSFTSEELIEEYKTASHEIFKRAYETYPYMLRRLDVVKMKFWNNLYVCSKSTRIEQQIKLELVNVFKIWKCYGRKQNLEVLANVYHYFIFLDKKDESIEHLTHSLNILDRYYPTRDYLKTVVYQNAASVWTDQNKKLEVLAMALQHAQKSKIRSPGLVPHTLVLIGGQQSAMEDDECAKSNFEQALILFDLCDNSVRNKYISSICNCYHYLGQISKDNINEYEAYFQKALDTESYAPYSKFTVLFNLGTKFVQSNYEKALVYFQQACSIVMDIKEADKKEGIINNLYEIQEFYSNHYPQQAIDVEDLISIYIST